MMELVVQKNALLRELQLFQGIVERKNTIPILANVLIEANGEEVRLAATDLEVGLRSSFKAQVAKSGSLTLPAKKLFEIVKALPDTDVRIEEDRNGVKVAAERWQAVLLLSIKGRLALGHRGHGSQLGEDVVRGVAIPLNQPSIIQAAFETGRIVTTIPDETGAVQGRLERLLSMPRFPAAMPIATGGSVTFILTVGDPVVGEPDAAARELERLGTEFAAALARFAVT